MDMSDVKSALPEIDEKPIHASPWRQDMNAIITAIDLLIKKVETLDPAPLKAKAPKVDPGTDS